MLQNAYLLAKIGADTAENEQHFAEFCQKLATTLLSTGPPGLGGLHGGIVSVAAGPDSGRTATAAALSLIHI